MDLIWTGQSPMRIQNWGVLLLTPPWGLLQQPSQIPHPLVNSKIHRWRAKEKEQDKSSILRAGPGRWGPRVSVDISDGSFMPDQLLKPPSWAASSKLMCTFISRDGQGFGPCIALKAPCWVHLAGCLFGLSTSHVAWLWFLAAASASKRGQSFGDSFRAQNIGHCSLAPAQALSAPVWSGRGIWARRALHLWLSFS